MYKPTIAIEYLLLTSLHQLLISVNKTKQLASDVTCFSLEAHTSGSICIVIEGQCRVTNYSIAEG